MKRLSAGLHEKYMVTNNETGGRVTDCFVLRPEQDHAARRALYVYATHCGNVALRDDLHAWVLSLDGRESWLPPGGEWWWCGECERKTWSQFPECRFCGLSCDRWTGEDGE